MPTREGVTDGTGRFIVARANTVLDKGVTTMPATTQQYMNRAQAAIREARNAVQEAILSLDMDTADVNLQVLQDVKNTLAQLTEHVTLWQYPSPPVPAAAAVITICGSMRFYDDMLLWAASLTLKGSIILMPFITGATGDTKSKLDELHYTKIKMSDGVLVVCPGGYIGESTRKEIAYATELGIPVEYTHSIESR
jgi:hypothetical protein